MDANTILTSYRKATSGTSATSSATISNGADSILTSYRKAISQPTITQKPAVKAITSSDTNKPLDPFKNTNAVVKIKNINTPTLQSVFKEAVSVLTRPNIGAYLGEKLLQKVGSGEIKPKKLGEAFIGGAKTVPGTVQQAGGIIGQNLLQMKRKIDDFFKPATHTILRTIGATDEKLKKFDLQEEQNLKRSENIALQLRDTGSKSQQKAVQEYATKNTASTGLQGYLEMAAFNLPQMMTSVGLTVATAVTTKNPQLASAVGLSTSYGFGASEVYNEARRSGLTDKEALPLAQMGGVIIGAIDSIPLTRLITKTGSAEVVKKSIIKKIAQQMVSVGVQAGFEGITEGIQEIVGNAIKQTYDENQGLFEGVTESAIVGMILGGGSDITVAGVTSVLGKNTDSKKVSEDTQKKIEQAIDTPPESRTKEQKQIVEIISTTEMTPQEAIAYVAVNDLDTTTEGKEIMKLAGQAQQQDMNIKIVQSEDGGSLDASIVDKSFTPLNQSILESKEDNITYDRVTPTNENLDSLSKTAKTYKSEGEFIVDHIYKNMEGLSSSESIKKQQLADIYKKSQGIQEVPKSQLPTGEGKEKVSRLESRMKGIFNTATEDQIKQFGLSTYQQMNKKETIGKAAEYVTDNPDEALKIIAGEIEAPSGIPPEAIYVAMLESIPETQNAKQLTLATKLASLQATAIGQRMSLLTEIDKDSPVKLLNDIYKIREEQAKKRYGKSRNEAVKNVKKEMKKKIKVDKDDWNDFINSIEC